MLDIIMVALFIVLPILMVGLTNWSQRVVEQGSEKK
ncbi:hypothetical protein JOC75_001049 [Metabacillus crassostreae]|nr:hypothetical protein [Metabacillus crassostreae]